MTEEKPKRNWWMTLSKVVFFITAFFLVVFTVVGNMGGNTEEHKKSIEEFVAESTGYKARVKTLHNLSYFPTFSVDFEDMDMYRGSTDNVSAVHIDRLQAALGFWDVAFRTGKMKILNVIGARIMPGVWLDKPVVLKNFSIVDEDEGVARLEGKGTIGDKPLLISMDMAYAGTGRGRKYWFAESRNFLIEAGDVKIEAVLKNATHPYLTLKDLKIFLKGKEVVTGHLEMSKRRAHEVTLTGNIEIAENKTRLSPDLVIDLRARRATGGISSENFHKGDFSAGSRFDLLAKEIVSVIGDARKDHKMLDDFFAGQGVSLNVKGDVSYGGRLRFEDNTLLLKAP